MAGVGFDADVVASLDLPLKRRLSNVTLGKLAYVASIMGRLRDYRRCSYSAELDGVAVEGASLVAAKAHFYGGRFVLAPAARLDEPTFQVVLFGRGGRGAALGYMAAMAAGTLPRCSSVRIVPARQVRLSEPPGAGVQIDGDIHVRLPVTLRIAATPLQLIQPLLP
jgi:diacylglycerol kinase family enzyme